MPGGQLAGAPADDGVGVVQRGGEIGVGEPFHAGQGGERSGPGGGLVALQRGPRRGFVARMTREGRLPAAAVLGYPALRGHGVLLGGLG